MELYYPPRMSSHYSLSLNNSTPFIEHYPPKKGAITLIPGVGAVTLLCSSNIQCIITPIFRYDSDFRGTVKLCSMVALPCLSVPLLPGYYSDSSYWGAITHVLMVVMILRLWNVPFLHHF